jgi:DNA repair protein RecN (Recombination protein N)
MLRELHITNFAIIDELQLSFAPGMNVLTGETGAGKSIVTRAIGLLCGDRASVDLIRSDSEEAEIEGLFDLGDGERRRLTGTDLPVADDLVVRRVISRGGKGKVYVNGRLATTGTLAELGRELVHVYGQHEHSLLLKPDSHLQIIDEYGGLEEHRQHMAEAYADYREAADRVAALTANRDAVRQRLELLRFQVGELRAMQLDEGEEQALQRERERLRHAEKLGMICQQCESALYSADDAIAAALARVAGQLQEANRLDESFAARVESLRQCIAQVEDVAFELRRAGEDIRHDPGRLDEVEERLAALSRLKRKYDCEADGLVGKLSDLEAELQGLEDSGTDLAQVREDLRVRATRAWETARALSRNRQAAVQRLEKDMAAELASLGLEGAVFRAIFAVAASDGPRSAAEDSTGAELGAEGGDIVEFYLSANPGEAPKALARIASGGELSRIMLAVKALTAGDSETGTLIFDEVDVGIGGAVAEAVGKRLHVLGRGRQVLCITHLPQIAALADHHFAVEKEVAGGRTVTRARALPAKERVGELARMLGATGTPESREYARRLMRTAGKSLPR